MRAPESLHIDGVDFPLEVSAGGVRVAVATPSLDALQLVLARLSNVGVPAEERARFARGEDFAVPNLSARRIAGAAAAAGAAGAADAIANWRAFAGRDPGDDFYLVSASFAPHPIAVPRATMIQLIAELWRLSERVRNGLFETAPAPSPETAPAPVAAQPAPAAPPSDDVLRDLEDRALLLDQLDPEDTLRSGLPGESLDALTAARRRTVLLGLRIAGLLTSEPAALASLRPRLASLVLPTLEGYLDAAVALRAYLRSAARAELLPPGDKDLLDDLLQSAVSLDWFRKATPPGPATLPPDHWLARCEAAFLRARPAGPSAGRTYTKIDGVGTWLHYRSDLGPHLSLWRALPDPR